MVSNNKTPQAVVTKEKDPTARFLAAGLPIAKIEEWQQREILLAQRKVEFKKRHSELTRSIAIAGETVFTDAIEDLIDEEDAIKAEEIKLKILFNTLDTQAKKREDWLNAGMPLKTPLQIKNKPLKYKKIL